MTWPAGSDADFDTGMLRLKQRFLQHHFERHEQLEALLDTLRDGADAGPAAATAEAILHKIAGAAGSLGLKALGDAAFLTERYIRDQRRADRIDVTGTADVLDAFLDISLQVCRAERAVPDAAAMNRPAGRARS